MKHWPGLEIFSSCCTVLFSRPDILYKHSFSCSNKPELVVSAFNVFLKCWLSPNFSLAASPLNYLSIKPQLYFCYFTFIFSWLELSPRSKKVLGLNPLTCRIDRNELNGCYVSMSKEKFGP